jgi:hypothetical protein
METRNVMLHGGSRALSCDVVDPGHDNTLATSSPVEHLLAITDLTENSVCAIARALERGSVLRAQVTLLHVLEEGLPKRLTRQRRRGARELLADYVKLSCNGTDNDISINVRVGDSCLEIVREAIELGSDAIVVGLEEQYNFGSELAATAIDVVTFSDKPVLVVTQPLASPYVRALIAIEPRAASGWAIRATQRLAPEAETHLVRVVPTNPVEVNAPLHSFAASADAADLLVDCISQMGADLLVIGLERAFQHTYDDLSNLLRCVTDAHRCDLLFVRN